ncbi:MAG: thymidylate synthase [Acidimicrobiales bacterium]
MEKVPASSKGLLATVVRGQSLGRGWLEATRTILAEGHKASYAGSPILEVGLMDLVIEDVSESDGLIERLGDPERISWMHKNFTDCSSVDELGGAASYATRLYDYDASGRDQIAWVTKTLRADSASRSAVITTLQPLSDTSYIPCVSLLQFWMPNGRLELIVTAHSIDFATKGYANLIELAAIQRHVASSLGTSTGWLALRVSSAHIYERDLETVRTLLVSSGGPRQ